MEAWALGTDKDGGAGTEAWGNARIEAVTLLVQQLEAMAVGSGWKLGSNIKVVLGSC